jgi:hypothetical protein
MAYYCISYENEKIREEYKRNGLRVYFILFMIHIYIFEYTYMRDDEKKSMIGSQKYSFISLARIYAN